jgi:hypothetical protein
VAAADTASGFLDALRAVRTESELEGIRKRIAPGDDAVGPDAVERFLDDHAAHMRRAAVRSAVDKLSPAVRSRFVG